MSMFGFLGEALAHGAEAIAPLFGTAAMAAAIVLCTLGVRAALHPLARAAARGEQARSALAPRMAELQRTHKGNPERLQKAVSELYAETGSSPLAGCLPTLLQLPVFFVMYHLFSTGGGGLQDHTLLGAPLTGHWSRALADGGVFGPHGRVYLALFALIAAVATWNFRRARAAAAAAPQPAAGGTALPGMSSLAKVMPLLSFATLITLAVVPLAAGLYVVTTTTWTACERALLQRNRGRGEPAAAKAPGGKPSRAAAQAAPSGERTPAPADGAPGARVPQQRPAPRRTDGKGGPKTRAARRRAARARANSRTGSRSGTPAGARPADGAKPPAKGADRGRTDGTDGASAPISATSR
ncbi:membrane protein insertase YidC [Streptomyces angustmyceticus]|uniref:YidC/Oxa1 family membrane protein insertase n=1 Tax=Streptomyces angustmyceticus TaxID=285578 RepID=UPI003D8A6072